MICDEPELNLIVRYAQAQLLKCEPWDVIKISSYELLGEVVSRRLREIAEVEARLKASGIQKVG